MDEKVTFQFYEAISLSELGNTNSLLHTEDKKSLIQTPKESKQTKLYVLIVITVVMVVLTILFFTLTMGNYIYFWSKK